MNENIIPRQAFLEGKERCPECGNKIFLEYGRLDEKFGHEPNHNYRLPESVRCTFCFNDYSFMEEADGYVKEEDFYKYKVPQFKELKENQNKPTL